MLFSHALCTIPESIGVCNVNEQYVQMLFTAYIGREHVDIVKCIATLETRVYSAG
jgi:hypothetical protein